MVTDSISLTASSESAAREVNFLSVFDSTLATLKSDGLLGLSPNPRKSQSGEEMHLLVNELVEDGTIGKAVFAIYLTDL